MILQVGDDGNVCTSVVEFNPTKEDDQKFLSCQARNELIDDIAVEDQWKITVYCKFINDKDIFHIFFCKKRYLKFFNVYGKYGQVLLAAHVTPTIIIWKAIPFKQKL